MEIVFRKLPRHDSRDAQVEIRGAFADDEFSGANMEYRTVFHLIIDRLFTARNLAYCDMQGRIFIVPIAQKHPRKFCVSPGLFSMSEIKRSLRAYSSMLTSVYSRLPKPISAACSSVCRPLRDSIRWMSEAPSSAA